MAATKSVCDRFSRRFRDDARWTYRETAAEDDCMIADPAGTANLLLAPA